MQRKPTDVLIRIDRPATRDHSALATDATTMGAYLASPQRTVRGGLIVIQEIFGVTPAMRAIADEFAAEGYAVLVPDIYWRLGRNLNLGNGEDPRERQVAVDYASRYDEVLGTDDIIAAMHWLAAHLGDGSVPAVLGFCLGGRMAVRVASKSDAACMISMYGVGLDKFDAEIRSIGCPVQFHFGENDNHNPLSVIESVRASVDGRKRGVDEFLTYANAEHAFYNRFRLDRFNEGAHRLARQRVLAFLARHATAATIAGGNQER